MEKSENENDKTGKNRKGMGIYIIDGDIRANNIKNPPHYKNPPLVPPKSGTRGGILIIGKFL